jgi:hypothetical protein
MNTMMVVLWEVNCVDESQNHSPSCNHKNHSLDYD